MMRIYLALFAAFTPLFAHAETFKELVDKQVVPFVDTLVSLFYALAFVFFLIGMLRFFYSQSDEDRTKGKQHMVWGLVGLVVLFSVWGLVKLLLSILPGTGV